jgi:putative membrane protein (TIGR04086 family)
MKGRRFTAAKALIRGLLAAIAVTLLGMLLLAAAIVFISLSDGAIRVLNQVLKAGAVIAGTYLGVGRGGERGLMTGAGIGAIYAILGYAMYTLLGGNAFRLTELLGELLLALAAGAASGAVFANLKPARRHT